jgi:hypothetical protein
MHAIRVLAALALVVGAGIVHGAWTARWRPTRQLAALTAQFETVPMDIGDWRGTAFELPSMDLAMTGATACLSRRYSNPSRGVTVSVLLLGGLPGRISTHTPDVCYPGAGYALSAPTSFEYRSAPDKPPSVFRTALAIRGGPNPSALRLLWSWNASKGWTTPDEPRWTFASEPMLCKLYVIRETAGANVAPENDPCSEFLGALLPALDRCVFSAQ